MPGAWGTMTWRDGWLLVGLALPSCLGCEEVGCIGQVEAIVPAARIADGEWVWQADLPVADEFCVIVIEDMQIVDHNCVRWAPRLDGGDMVLVAAVPPADPKGQMLDVEVGWARLGDEIILQLLDLDWTEPLYPNGKACDRGLGCQSANIRLSAS